MSFALSESPVSWPWQATDGGYTDGQKMGCCARLDADASGKPGPPNGMTHRRHTNCRLTSKRILTCANGGAPGRIRTCDSPFGSHWSRGVPSSPLSPVNLGDLGHRHPGVEQLLDSTGALSLGQFPALVVFHDLLGHPLDQIVARCQWSHVDRHGPGQRPARRECGAVRPVRGSAPRRSARRRSAAGRRVR
jgi:hypothetical protein